MTMVLSQTPPAQKMVTQHILAIVATIIQKRATLQQVTVMTMVLSQTPPAQKMVTQHILAIVVTIIRKRAILHLAMSSYTQVAVAHTGLSVIAVIILIRMNLALVVKLIVKRVPSAKAVARNISRHLVTITLTHGQTMAKTISRSVEMIQAIYSQRHTILKKSQGKMQLALNLDLSKKFAFVVQSLRK